MKTELLVVDKQQLQAVEAWEEQRVRRSLRTLLAVAEQVAVIMGHGFEPRLSAPPENARQPGHRLQRRWEFELPQVIVGRVVAKYVCPRSVLLFI